MGETYCRNLTEDAVEVVRAFQTLGKEVWLVTGSFAPAVHILAKKLQIPLAQVKTNVVYFQDCGCYQAIDTQGRLTKQFGKAEIVLELGKKNELLSSVIVSLIWQQNPLLIYSSDSAESLIGSKYAMKRILSSAHQAYHHYYHCS